MRFSRLFSMVVAVLAVTSSTAAAPSKYPEFESGLKPRAILQPACGPVGPITTQDILPFLWPRITILPQMCLCSVAGILTADSLARVIDQLILGQQNGLLSRVLQLLGTTVDGLLRLILPSITGPLDKGACTTTIPDNGYPKCPAASAPAGACTFGCNDGYKVCGTGCILQAVTCPSSVQRRSDRRLNICPQGWTSCPVAHGKKIAYECVATQSDLESCGGCAGIEGQGVDCSALVGVNDVSCVAGKCEIQSCLRGFERILGGSTAACVPIPGYTPRRSAFAH